MHQTNTSPPNKCCRACYTINPIIQIVITAFRHIKRRGRKRSIITILPLRLSTISKLIT